VVGLDEARPPHTGPKLLAELASERSLRRLSGLEESTRQIPQPGVRGTCAARQQHAAFAVG